MPRHGSLKELGHIKADGKRILIYSLLWVSSFGTFTGTSREMVTRALKELEELGHIKVDGKRILIYSLPK